MTKNINITLPSTSNPRPAFPVPRSPYPWIWRCHKCRIDYRFSAALNRCLTCSHRFCPKCVSEFDYSGWEHWKSYWRPGYNVNASEHEDVDEEAYKPRIATDTYEQRDPWEGFESIVIDRQIHSEMDMNLDTTTPTPSPPTSPSSTSSDSWESHLPTVQAPTTLYPPIYATGKECKPMCDWTPPTTGYRSVQEARKALYPGCDGDYGTGEEGETMHDWPAYSPPDEIKCQVYMYAGCGGEDEDEGVVSPPLMSPVGLGSGCSFI